MLWKIYVWSFLVLNAGWFLCLVVGVGPANGVELGAIDWVDVPISLVALVGVLGFAHRRRIASRWFWGCWLFLALSWDGLNHFGVIQRWTDPAYHATVTEMMNRGVLWTLASLPLVGPAYAALFLYVGRWRRLADIGNEGHAPC